MWWWWLVIDCVLFHHVYSDLHAPCERISVSKTIEWASDDLRLPLSLALSDRTANEARLHHRVNQRMQIHFEGYSRRQVRPFRCTSRHACECGRGVDHSTDDRVVLWIDTNNLIWTNIKKLRERIKRWCNLPIEAENPPGKGLASRGFIKSPKWPIGRHPPTPFFFFDFDDNLRFRVWIPSFFIVNGRFTCKLAKNAN